MKEKHGITAIIFNERNGKHYLLLLHRAMNWKGWEFCKGGIEGTEKPEESLLREIEEETGLKTIQVIAKLPDKISWSSKGMKYIYTPFILRGTMDDKVDLHQEIIEHDAFRWVEEKEVERMLTHIDNKKVFN